MRKLPRVVLKCGQCGAAFEVRESEANRQFCSRKCGNTAIATKHGHTRVGWASRTYCTWQNMRARCQNPKATKYAAYGAKGIRVCERWEVFDNFLADMGERPEGMTLDRIDASGDYKPENCRWATPAEQQSHISRANIVSYKGERLRITYLARRLGLNVKTLQARVKARWPEEEWARAATGKKIAR